MKKVLFISSMFLFISCGSPENCETEIIDGLVYKNDKLYTGKCAFYDDNNGGMISSHEFNNGKFHGKWKFYYPSGQLQTVGKFDNGLRIGTWNYYHENGKKSQVSRYLKGKKHGAWKVYDEDGGLTLEQEWSEGVAVIDTTRSNNIFQDLKIDGYDIKPITIDPNLD
jgi:antitoxin component YwqK of YwqJK toxin-antitoxin module